MVKPTAQHLFDDLETYKDIFDHAHDLIHIIHPDGKIIYVNRAWERMLEFSNEEVRGRSIYSFVAEEDREEFVRYREGVLLGEIVDRQIVVALITKSGNKIYVEGFVSVRIVNGIPVYTRGIFRDITTRLRNEHQLKVVNQVLQERESNWKQLLNHAPDAIITIDSQSIITYWNPKAATMFGFTPEEVVGKSLSETIIPPQYREAHARGMARYLATGEAHVLNRTVELTALDKDRQEFYVSLTISSSTQNGQPAFIAFIRNIDQEKRNEIDLEKKRIELEKSNEELEQFAHVASHDLQEPVRKIRLFAEYLKSELSKSSAKSRMYLDKIELAASRLTNMIQGILTHSSVAAERPRFLPVSLHAVIGQVLSDLEMLIEERKAVVHLESLPVVYGHEFLIYQLFYNLLSNSLKFVRAGVPPLIKVQSTEITQDGRAYYAISVQDNGIGFSSENHATIFRKFSRLHSKDKFEGTGLGLSLCKNIIEKHQGFITAAGHPDQGAIFTVYFPKRSTE